MDYISADWGAG